MVLTLAAFACYAAYSGKSRGDGRDGREVDALRNEIPELRQQPPPALSDEFRGRR